MVDNGCRSYRIRGRAAPPPVGAGVPESPDAVAMSLAFVAAMVPLVLMVPDADAESFALVVAMVPDVDTMPEAVAVSSAFVVAMVPEIPEGAAPPVKSSSSDMGYRLLSGYTLGQLKIGLVGGSDVATVAPFTVAVAMSLTAVVPCENR